MPNLPLRRRTVLAAASLLAVGALAAAPAFAAPTLNAPAPAFQAKDADGRVRSLDEFKGKIVVLEWHNPGCPYVQKHYGSGNMQSLQQRATGEGVVWLTVDSGAPGEQGYLEGAAAKAWKAQHHAHSTDLLLDHDGKIGRLYGARTTPHMFVIDKTGRLVYMGGIDDRPYTDPESLKGAKNYVALALADLEAGRPVAEPVTRPYGCSVKYSSAD
jgi:peroxiredoxin